MLNPLTNEHHNIRSFYGLNCVSTCERNNAPYARDDKPSTCKFVSTVIYVYQIQFYKPYNLAIFYGDLFSILMVKFF